MNIWLIEPYYTGSHKSWADGYKAHSQHTVELLTLPGRFWKWRMQGGAISLARQAQARIDAPDLILASDMLNVPLFSSLWQGPPLGIDAELAPRAEQGRMRRDVPIAYYFHENQLTYPLQPGEKRDLHYGFINTTSALQANEVFFNSTYHLEAFFEELPRLLKHFPDYNELWAIDALRAKSSVLPLGLDLASFDWTSDLIKRDSRPLILWNHRWEYDKDPTTFFRAMYTLADMELDFGLILLGESFRNQPEEFLDARERMPGRIVHFGYAPDRSTYGRLLREADIVISTALHDFFGIAIVEACYCGCFPIVPRRLAYPELIPSELHGVCLWDDFDSLVNLLLSALDAVEAKHPRTLEHHMAGFDWSQMASQYDERFSNLVRAGSTWHKYGTKPLAETGTTRVSTKDWTP